jgi:serine/threonine protein kinase
MAGASGWEGRRHSIAQVIDVLRQRVGWKLDNPLGEGEFNYVFREEIDGLPRAVKISKDPVAVDDREWNVREWDALEMVRHLNGHPHLLRLVKLGKALGHVVTVWELADGTLESALQERLIDGRGPFSAQELLPWMEEAAEAIDALNERGIYHRDIKPQNLFLLHGHVKVGDFGLVKQMGLSTVSHSRVGTRGYLPPECYQGKLVDWVDVYALCATYVRLRTGRAPFGENGMDVVRRQERGGYARGGLSAAEMACLDELLQPGAGQRWGRRPAREWVRELREALHREAIYGSSYRRKRSPTLEPNALPEEAEPTATSSQEETPYHLELLRTALEEGGEEISQAETGWAFADPGGLGAVCSDRQKQKNPRKKRKPNNLGAVCGDRQNASTPAGKPEAGADNAVINWAEEGTVLGVQVGAIAGIIVGIYLALQPQETSLDASPGPATGSVGAPWVGPPVRLPARPPRIVPIRPRGVEPFRPREPERHSPSPYPFYDSQLSQVRPP